MSAELIGSSVIYPAYCAMQGNDSYFPTDWQVRFPAEWFTFRLYLGLILTTFSHLWKTWMDN